MTSAKSLFLCLLLAAAAACARHPDPEAAAGYPAAVTAVADGDTVRVTDGHGRKHKIRLAYIDAPETDQAHGRASREALQRLLDGQRVRIEVFDTDQYGREVARVSLNGQDVNLSQIQNGHAWHYRSIARKNQSPDDYRRYEAAENRAKQNRTGLWRQSDPVAPWTFRYRKRHAAPSGRQPESP